jgi:hypothetical protein
LKPVTAHEEIIHNRALRQQHPELVTNDEHQFVQTLKDNPRLYNTVASALWGRLKRSLGGHLDRAVFGWRWGKSAAINATDEQVQSDPYVQKYLTLMHEAKGVQGRHGPTATMHLQKDALSAGNPNAAPSTLTGGAALAREDLRRSYLNGAKAALRDWDRQSDFREFLKSRLPEADPAFIEHFADMVGDYDLQKREETAPKRKPPTNAQKAARKQKRMGPVMPEDAEPRPAPENKRGLEYPPAAPALPAPGVAPRLSTRSRVHMDENAVLHTPQGDFQQAFPTAEHQGEHSANVYQAILNPYDESLQHHLGDTSPDHLEESVHAPWRRAMDNWMVVNKMLRGGKLPDSVVHHAVAFSAMSPNTPVPLQELYYGYLMDLSKKFKVDISKPMSRAMLARLRQGISSNMALPEWEREHYRGQEGKMRESVEGEDDNGPSDKGAVITGSDGRRLTHLDKPHPDLMTEEQRWPGHPISDMRANDPPQLQGLTAHHTWLPHLANLVHHYGTNGRDAASMMMRMRAEHQPGAKFPLPFGFGPKLTRYTLGMLGAGNIIVPDRHMIRHTFNLRLPQGKNKNSSDWADNDREQIAHLTRVLSKEDNHHVLEAMDHHFFTKHPAVQHVLNQYPEHFKGHEDQAIFPAFWLHWLTIPHHERLRGMPHVGFNGGTDHYPFWASIKHTSSTRTASLTTTRPSTSARTSARARTARSYCPSAPRARCTRSTPSTARWRRPGRSTRTCCRR